MGITCDVRNVVLISLYRCPPSIQRNRRAAVSRSIEQLPPGIAISGRAWTASAPAIITRLAALALLAREPAGIPVQNLGQVAYLDQLFAVRSASIEAGKHLQEFAHGLKVLQGVGLNWMPMSSRKAWSSARPLYVICPEVGHEIPSSISSVVILPAPFGPGSPTHCPCCTSRLMPSTARTSGKTLVSSRASSRGVISWNYRGVQRRTIGIRKL